jgi:hypothetical protein
LELGYGVIVPLNSGGLLGYRLGGSDYADFNGELPSKPKGMHWRTYEREIARIETLENACNLYLTEAIAHFATDFDWWRACAEP